MAVGQSLRQALGACRLSRALHGGGLAVLPLLRRPLELLRFESTVARSFGSAYRRDFSAVLLVSCALAASGVGAVGPIVFVGLIVPHLARKLRVGISRSSSH